MENGYNDERLTGVEDERKTALAENQNLYKDMANQTDQYYNAQIEASKQWAAQQSAQQQAQTDFAIQQIEQQKVDTTKDYTKEQSGAYVDWQKESNQYGANAEMLAAQGLAGSGYSETSQVGMYNAYQNRLASARESYNTAIQNYNNAIAQARLQNSSAQAEIAYTAMQQQLELSLQGFQYKNGLIAEMTSRNDTIQNRYDSKYLEVLNQMNAESGQSEEGSNPFMIKTEGQEEGNDGNGQLDGPGAMTETGDTLTLEIETESGEVKTVTQPVLKAGDGSLWYFNPSKNRYMKLSIPASAEELKQNLYPGIEELRQFVPRQKKAAKEEDIANPFDWFMEQNKKQTGK